MRGSVVATALLLSPAVAVAASLAAPASAARPGAAERVAISDFAYRPARIVVPRGTRVVWRDLDVSNHTVTFRRRDLGNVDQGETVSARFRHRGTFRYVCEYHPSMHGAVVVR
jgi:plastocyanin